MPRSYNFIYSELVEDENDFVGQVAYSLYKQDKIKYIEDYKEENSADITDQALETFHKMSCNETMIEAYRIKAEGLLEEFINDTLEETIDEVRSEIIANQAQILSDIIDPIRPPSTSTVFWMGVAQSTLATIVFSAIVALLILILYTSKVGFLNTINALYNEKPIIQNSQKNIRTDSEKVNDSSNKKH